MAGQSLPVAITGLCRHGWNGLQQPCAGGVVVAVPKTAADEPYRLIVYKRGCKW